MTTHAVGSLPLSVLAWLTCLAACLLAAAALRGRAGALLSPAALAVGALALASHAADLGVTLAVSPDLALETNPIWRPVIDGWGLPIARAYGLTGKLMVSVLSWQLYALYLAQREGLYPRPGLSFIGFLGSCGTSSGAVSWRRLASLGAYVFGLSGPIFLYAALLNSLVEAAPALHESLPGFGVAVSLYAAVVTLSHPVASYRTYRLTCGQGVTAR